MRSFALLPLVLVACLDVPKSPTGMCKASSDCASGEVCQENVCWGDPPTGMYAATLGPPSGRADLVATEIPALALPADGWLGDLVIPAPVTVSGRVEGVCGGCTTSSLGATITVTRRSLFAGGPGFTEVITAKDGVPRGANSYTIDVPRAQPGEPPYVITVMPDGRGDQPSSSGPSPAMIVPPQRLTVDGAQDSALPVTLGSTSAKIVTGTLTDGQLTPHPLSNYRVVALGHWDAAAPLTEVSTVAYVGAMQPTDGGFSLTIADGVVGSLEIQAKPYDPSGVSSSPAPTLYLSGVTPGNTPAAVVQPTELGNPVVVSIPIEGVNGDGTVGPVSGATVTVTGSFSPQLHGTQAVLTAQATTGDDGIAKVTLLDGATLLDTYKLRVVPPASSPLGVVYDAQFAVAPSLAPVRLPGRIALRGTIVDSTGAPLSNVSVTVRPGLRFTWGLDSAAQGFLSQIPVPTAVTPDNGGFVVWIDPFLDSVWGSYDVSFEPPLGSASASWIEADVDVPRVPNQDSLSVGQVMIPDASHVHGRIVDAGDNPIAGGEMRIFQLVGDMSLCGQVSNAPAECVIPAPLVGHAASDDLGIIRLTLARP